MSDPPPSPEPSASAAAPEPPAEVAHAPAPPPPPVHGSAGWPPWLAAAALVTGFGITIVAGLLVFVVATAAGVEEGAPGINIGLTLVQNLALAAAAYFFGSLPRGRAAAADFGLRRAPFWTSVGLLIAVWVAFLVLSGIWAVALELDQQQDLPKELGADGPLINVLAVVVLVTVVAPLGEELFFRGFFFGALRNWRGPWLAALITGVVFEADTDAIRDASLPATQLLLNMQRTDRLLRRAQQSADYEAQRALWPQRETLRRKYDELMGQTQ